MTEASTPNEEARRFEERSRRLARAQRLGGVITADTEAARRRTARVDPALPLSAWTIAVKDNIHVAGLPNTAGTAALRDFVPDEDAPVVRILREAGAVVIAKANMHELAFGATSNNVSYGGVRNPVDPERSSGGSSGGTATTVAVGAARIGLGTDTGGSVRVPAALTGLVGFRPTTGRYPSGGVTPLSSIRDTIGVMADTVADVLAVDRVLVPLDVDSAQPGGVAALTLGVPTSRLADDLDPAVTVAWESGLARLRAAGVVVREVDIDAAIAAEDRSGLSVVLAEARPRLEGYLRRYVPELSIEGLLAAVAGADVAETVARFITDEDEAAAVMRDAAADIARARAAYAAALRDVDALVFPTTPATAQLLGQEDASFLLNGRRVDTFTTMIRNTGPGSFAGVPGVTLPLRVATGSLPVGLALDGPRSADRRLLRVADALAPIVC